MQMSNNGSEQIQIKYPAPSYVWWVYSRPAFARTLEITSLIAVLLVVSSFAGAIAYLAVFAWPSAVLFGIFCAVPFAAVTATRGWINAVRPCEVYDSVLLDLSKFKKGKSMPSRHVFSAFVIGTLALFVYLPLGISGLLLGVYIAVCRVLLFKHFVRDVLVGALIGVFSGAVGGIILNFNFL